MNIPTAISKNAQINFTDDFLQRCIENGIFYIDQDFSTTGYSSLWHRNPQMGSGYSLVTKSYLNRRGIEQGIYNQDGEIIVGYLNNVDPIYLHTSGVKDSGAPMGVCANQDQINDMIHHILFAKK